MKSNCFIVWKLRANIWKRHFDQLKLRLENAQCERFDTLYECGTSLPSVAVPKGVQRHAVSGGDPRAASSPRVGPSVEQDNFQDASLPGVGDDNSQSAISPVEPGAGPVQPLRQSSLLRHPPSNLLKRFRLSYVHSTHDCGFLHTYT